MTALNRVTVEDVRNIWIHRIIAETGLPSYKVNITRNIVDSMEDVLNKRLATKLVLWPTSAKTM